MLFNPIIFPAIIIGTVLFFIGQRVAKKVKGKPVRILLGLLFILLCVPNFLFVAYYLKILDEPFFR